ncbi:hypothetical protein BJ875DRAFT_487010 [Amylocarpus encephaloides]|uniref:Uncharacterized protein n=1 Tax=Amylocarpus encephaloides TaxID=45428 RepID=A0A9P7YD16_9HELO|nr:hypothetical protein BJ875DRAFT_487010 [Amylocarpus encephaloides]
MTRGKHDEKSAERISRAKPGSREASAAVKAAKRNSNGGGGGGQSKGGDSSDRCQTLNRSGGRCSDYEPCDFHFANR